VSADFELSPEDAAAPITRAGCVLLLTLARAADRRVDAGDAAAFMWHMLLGADGQGAAVRAGDAMAAMVAHYQQPDARPVMPGDIIGAVEEWSVQWVQGNRAGLRPPGWPEAAEELISGPELARRSGLPLAQPLRALPGGAS